MLVVVLVVIHTVLSFLLLFSAFGALFELARTRVLTLSQVNAVALSIIEVLTVRVLVAQAWPGG